VGWAIAIVASSALISGNAPKEKLGANLDADTSQLQPLKSRALDGAADALNILFQRSLLILLGDLITDITTAYRSGDRSQGLAVAIAHLVA
jgi:hypothetical protein